MPVRRDARRLWRQHRLGFLALLAISALVLGFIGYRLSDATVVNAAYGTLSLLAFNYYLPPGDPHTALQIARFMVPTVAAFATFSALVAVLEDQWHLVRARRRRGHVVVCGLGRRGMRLVRSLRDRDRASSVVAIEADRANPNVKAARDLGAIVTIADATEAENLDAARVHRASTLVSVLSEDADNAAAASAARELCDGRAGSLEAYCHVADMDLVEDLTSAAIGSGSEALVLEWFSVPERAARLLLSEHAELVGRSKEGERPHLVLVGADDLARAIAVNAARQWRAVAGADAEPLRITVAWEGSGDWLRRLTDRHPSVARVAELQAYEHDLRAVGRADEARGALDDATAIFICAPSDTESLEVGFAASRVLSARKTVVVRLLIENAGFVGLLHSETGGSPIRLFNIIDRTCSAEMITDGLTETLARALHAIYLRQATDSDASVPWAELPETYKQASRAQARHVSTKLREAGCGIRPLSVWDAPLLELEAEVVEPLAELEHERWMAERLERGWKLSVPTNERKTGEQTSEWLVPWDELPDQIREYDREFVRDLPKVFASAGYEMYRTGNQPVYVTR